MGGIHKSLVYASHKGSVMQSCDIFVAVKLNKPLQKSSVAYYLRPHVTHYMVVINFPATYYCV